MSDMELRAAKALLDCSFGHDRAALGFVGRVYVTLSSDERWPLKSWEKERLWSLVWKYRRQIPDAPLVAAADREVNGALALVF